jgi:hypothetical protein
LCVKEINVSQCHYTYKKRQTVLNKVNNDLNKVNNVLNKVNNVLNKVNNDRCNKAGTVQRCKAHGSAAALYDAS